jgi:dipeptidyl-peptidase 4
MDLIRRMRQESGPRPARRHVRSMIVPAALAAAAALLAAGGPVAGPAASPPAAKTFTLETLYTPPSIIGTAPKAPVWSPDSRRVAFLWNEEGTRFYDVYMASIDDPKPVRLTAMPRRTPSGKPASSPEAVAEAEAVELDAGVGSLRWHPDGKRLLVTFRQALYLLTPGREPEKVTEAMAIEPGAVFSPDGTLQAFFRDGALRVRPVGDPAAPERELLKPAATGLRLRVNSWSPDGRKILVTEIDGRRMPRRKIPDYLLEETGVREVPRAFPGEETMTQRIGVVDLDAVSAAWLDLEGYPSDMVTSLAWSPDGREVLADVCDKYVKDRALLSADAATGAVREWVRERNPVNVTPGWQARWAPEGKGVYFLSDRDEDYHIYFLAAPGSAPRRITRGPWAVSSFEVSSAAKTIFLVGNEGRPEERHLFRVGLKGGAPVRLSRRPGTHSPVVSPDGRHAADIFSSDEIPFDLFLTRLATAAGTLDGERQVTRSPRPEFGDYVWVKPRYVTFPSRTDGAVLHGRLTLPPDLDGSKKYPAILGSVYSDSVRNQWGGRTAHPTWGLDQVLVQRGYVLLNVDIRGSQGHGTKHRQGLFQGYGVIDIEDLHSGVDYLKTLGFVDTGRIGIWGSSYGGLMTTMSLFKKPGLYAAGVAGAPATNVFHAQPGQMWVMMDPREHRDKYVASSPLFHAAGLRDPLMIIHGMRDTVVLYKDTVVLVDRLIGLGKDFDLVTLPDSEHSWDTGPSRQTIFAFRKLVEHFDRHLGQGPR